jgi:lysophospholipase L1-like esterase
MVNVGNVRKRLTKADGFKANRGTILGDSITKGIINLLQTKLQALSGGTMYDLANYIREGVMKVEGFRAIIIFLGCNDLRDDIPKDACAAQIVKSLHEAIAVIRQYNPDARIGVAGIIPKPRDANIQEMLDARIETNKAMKMYCRANRLLYYTTETFLKKRDPTKPIYAGDNLHLTPKGAEYLGTYLSGKIGELIGLPSQTDTP